MALDYEVYDLGNVALQRGATIRDCKMAYKTYGTLNPGQDNVIVYPTWFSGQHYENEWLIGAGKALDPTKYFIIIPNMLCNGLSSSPSNTPEPYNGPRFPQVTIYDNVRAQHRLLTEKFGIKRIRMVAGWSMAGLQAFHWGALYPDMVDVLAPFAVQQGARVTTLFSWRASRRRSLPMPSGWKAGTPISLRAVFVRQRGSSPAGVFLSPSIASNSTPRR